MRKLVLCLMMMIIIPSVYSSIDYYSDRMNFPPGESRVHNQTLTNNGASAVQVSATIPSGFSLSGTDCTIINASFVNCVIPAGSTKYFKLDSPSSCVDGTWYKSLLTSNTSFSEDFTFVCTPDNKITDCKVEYGHGEANYLDELYISNETTTLFNLVRVWNIGHYLTPNEPAKNATIECRYEKYPVRTYGRVEVEHDTTGVNGTYWWTEIEGGYWFRIGVISQEVSGKSIGDFYNVDCNQLVYHFEHQKVIANSTTCDLEVRSTEPFSCQLTSHPVFTNKEILTLTNSEKYTVHDISFDRTLNDDKHTETYRQLDDGDSISYFVDNGSANNITLFFIPSWYINSWSPRYYEQVVSCGNVTLPANNPPILISNIPDQAWQMNTNNTDAFDLDSYFGDIDADPLTYTCDNVSNITIIIDGSNQVSFIPDINWSGVRNTTCYANDSTNVTASNTFQLYVYNCGNSFVDPGEQCDSGNLSGQTCIGLGYASGNLSCTSSCSFNTSNCSSPPSPPGGGGGGGGGSSYTPPEEIPEVEVTGIDVDVIRYPPDINLQDDGFTVLVKVENIGDVPLSGVELGVGNITGWCFDNKTIGYLGVGEMKLVEFEFENCHCNYDYVVINEHLEIPFIGGVGNVWDVDVASFVTKLPEVTVLTDRKYYFENDVMRLCIIYNNTDQDENKSQLEYELNVYRKSYAEEEDFIVDYLTSYDVSGRKVLVVIKDYWIHDVMEVEEYIVRAVLYQKGDILDIERYELAEANTTVVLNGFIEDQILQGEETLYEFKYEDEVHAVYIRSFDENYVDLSVTSEIQNFRIRLLETEFVDLDGNDENDISLTYLGIKEGKADVRIRLVPKEPPHIGGDKDHFMLDLGEYVPITLPPSKLKRIAPIAETFVIIVIAALLLWYVIWLTFKYQEEIGSFLKKKNKNKKKR
ncbi:MAG: hypothetical protein V3V78_03380 [Candidatus Woesearchaeota archaeon]